jgi:hypothetical protein
VDSELAKTVVEKVYRKFKNLNIIRERPLIRRKREE